MGLISLCTSWNQERRSQTIKDGAIVRNPGWLARLGLAVPAGQ